MLPSGTFSLALSVHPAKVLLSITGGIGLTNVITFRSMSAKAFAPIYLTEPGIVISVRSEHSAKAELPIPVIELGIVTEASAEQRVKVLFLISVTELGISIEGNLEHP